MRKSINEKYILLLSHLTRGAWIEIYPKRREYLIMLSHLTRGAWIEIRIGKQLKEKIQGRTSHEVRGLKSSVEYNIKSSTVSHLTRGAWIEI